jgi:DNA replication protein DnaC
MTTMTILTHDPLKARAQALNLYGLLAHWEEVAESDWIEPLIQWEEAERARRGLQRRLKEAHLGRFKPLADFNWQWPSQCDRQAVEELMRLAFLEEAANIVLLGPNGVGKSTIARNVAHQAVLAGHTVRFTTAGQMLNELAAQDGDHALRRRIALYARPRLLVIDEVGYLSYSNRHADLLFEIVNRRYEEKSTLITTNRPFSEWNQVFPNAACVVSLIDRLVHHAEIIPIDGESYRLKEAKEQAEQRRKQRAAAKSKTRKKPSNHA